MKIDSTDLLSNMTHSKYQKILQTVSNFIIEIDNHDVAKKAELEKFHILSTQLRMIYI